MPKPPAQPPVQAHTHAPTKTPTQTPAQAPTQTSAQTPTQTPAQAPGQTHAHPPNTSEFRRANGLGFPARGFMDKYSMDLNTRCRDNHLVWCTPIVYKHSRKFHQLLDEIIRQCIRILKYSMFIHW